MSKKEEILTRFYKLKNDNKEFYERHPDLLKQLNMKIKALEENEYKIVDASWTIAYVGSLIINEQIMIGKEMVLKERKGKQNLTIEQAKEITDEFKKYKSK